MGSRIPQTSSSSPNLSAYSELTELEESTGRSCMSILRCSSMSCWRRASSVVMSTTFGWKQFRRSRLSTLSFRIMKPIRSRFSYAFFFNYQSPPFICWQYACSGYLESCSMERQVRKKALRGYCTASLQVCRNASCLVTLDKRISSLRVRAHFSASLSPSLSLLDPPKSSTTRLIRWCSIPHFAALRAGGAERSSLRKPTMATSVSLSASMAIILILDEWHLRGDQGRRHPAPH